MGDLEFKKDEKLKQEDQMITCFPEVQEQEINSESKFIILACDGVWDVLKNDECVQFIESKLNEKQNAKISEICGDLLERCIEKEDPNKA